MEYSTPEESYSTLLLVPQSDAYTKARAAAYRKDAIIRWKRKRLNRASKSYSVEIINVRRDHVRRDRNDTTPIIQPNPNVQNLLNTSSLPHNNSICSTLNIPTMSGSRIDKSANRSHRKEAILKLRKSKEPRKMNVNEQSDSQHCAVTHETHETGQVGQRLLSTMSSDPQPSGISVKKTRGKGKRKRAGAPPKKGRELLDFIPTGATSLPKRPNCLHCGAVKFPNETPNFCCSNGDIVLASNSVSNLLKDLFTSPSEESLLFRACVRTVNNMFAFTSFGVKCDKNFEKRNKGIYTFKVQGQVYHFLNDLETSKNLQLYFHDTESELADRLDACPRLTESIIQKVMSILEQNPYARFFRGLREVQNLDTCSIVLRALPEVDQRVFNKPTVSQVAALWVEGAANGETSRRDIQVYTHGGLSHNIEYYYGCYDPLQYPLLFPFGEIGWHQGISKKGKRRHRSQTRSLNSQILISPTLAANAEELIQREHDAMAGIDNDPNLVSVREYYAYKLQMRDNENSFLLHFGRLFQQYIVDMYVKLESQRLDFFRLQQEEIRREFLQGIQDCVSSGETQASNVGQRIFLPSSFIGGPRNMRRRYIDAMTLVQKFGKPDIFLTMTCNPNWPEIKECLIEREETQNRPDLIARVFHSKLEELKNELLKKNVFGEVAAYTYVIEFQKRGLPHAHFLLILKSHQKMYRPEEYDKIVCAEIPDKAKYPHLYNMVKKHMMHGPCGTLNPTNVCMTKKGKCRNSYPKDFCIQTTQLENSYPMYRRSNNGIRVKVRHQQLDNRWVVPYNAYLLAKFNCHINVEICSTIHAVKYIYKYICKGHDRISFHVHSDDPNSHIDEIQQYRTARWVSPPEAAWRLFRFSMGEIKPAIIHLQLHLENFQPVSFKRHERLDHVANNPRNKKTMLTEFFYMNRTDLDAKALNLTYSQFPEHFVWLSVERRWKLRARGDSIGRINSAHPTEGERYYLRLLSTKVRAPESFDDFKTYNGACVTTFREAALLRGLLQHDNSQEQCLQEASLFHMPYEMRRLFATLLVYSPPNNPRQLWLKFEAVMSEDFLRCPDLNIKEVQAKVLQQISGFLESMGKSINSFDLVPQDLTPFNVQNQTRELLAEKSIIVREEDLNAISLLNEKQLHAFRVISERIYESKSGAFFVDGPGGTGKSFLYRALLADVRSKGYLALATATSGIAASILPGGRTAHSRFKIPIDISDGIACNVSKQSSLATLIRESKLIIWDEAPMAKRSSIELLNDLLKDLCSNPEVFGGKVVVFGGDFRQTLPVIRRGNKSDTIDACLINSPLWKVLEKLELTENMRARLDPSFTSFLLRVGDGIEKAEEDNLIKIPSPLVLRNSDEDSALNDLINTVYPGDGFGSDIVGSPLNRAILTTKNTFVDEVNATLINKFPGEMVEYFSFDQVLNPTHEGQYEDIINSLSPSGLPPHKLCLKISSPIILLRNLDPTEGLCNGTRLICKNLGRNVIHAQISVGDFAGKDVFIHRIPLQPSGDEQYPVPYKRTQFPVRLCFAMTINKAQGQTLDFVGIYLREPVFSHGQLYVALSRARAGSQVKLLIKPPFFDVPRIDCTKNIVYKEVLEASKITNK